MATLLIRLCGPMQSWGTKSRFGDRDTEQEPSKSGVLGLVAAALGRARGEPLDDLAALKMAVRVDVPGSTQSDYQTAQDVAKASGARPETVLSRRYYLSGADFLAALEGPRELLTDIEAALRNPYWPMYLGRRGYVPSRPPWVPGGLVEGDAVSALQKHAWPQLDGKPVDTVEVIVECGPGEVGDSRNDVPVSFLSDDRRYVQRQVRRIQLAPLAQEA